MSCECCNAARECGNFGRLFDSLKCVYCAARLIQRIGKMKIGIAECTARRKTVLADSVAVGLDEDLIRTLVKGFMALEPEVFKGKRK